MKWLRAISYPYFALTFPAEWEEQVKERVKTWFEVKFKTDGRPTPYVWRAENHVSPSDTAWVEVQPITELGIDYGGCCMVDEPVVQIPALDLTLLMRVGTVGDLYPKIQYRLTRPARRKYGHVFHDLASWPGSVWMLPPDALVELEATVQPHVAGADAQFKAFMKAFERGG